MAFRLLDQAPVLFGDDDRLAGGTLEFYISGTSTPKDVYGDKALTVNLGSVESLDSSGRQVNDIWLSGSYTVTAKDSDGVQVWSRDDVEAASELPDQTGNTGKFLTTDGTDTSWSDIDALPAPAGGDNGDVLTLVAGSPAWAAPAAATDYAGATVTDAVFQNVREKTQAVTATATTTINYENGAVVLLAQAVDITSLVFQNFGASGEAATMTIIRTKDASATARTIAWGSVLFPGGADPTLTQTSGAIDVITLVSTNGTQIVGYSASAFS